MIGLGVLAVAGIGLYMWKKSKDESSSKSSSEDKSNALGRVASLTKDRSFNEVVPTPLGKLKKGDQQVFGQGKKKECCTWMGDYWKCQDAPCSITL